MRAIPSDGCLGSIIRTGSFYSLSELFLKISLSLPLISGTSLDWKSGQRLHSTRKILRVTLRKTKTSERPLKRPTLRGTVRNGFLNSAQKCHFLPIFVLLLSPASAEAKASSENFPREIQQNKTRPGNNPFLGHPICTSRVAESRDTLYPLGISLC